MSNKESQDDEILALESIFGDCFRSYESEDETDGAIRKNGELKITIELPDPFYLAFSNYKTGEQITQRIEHLPPLCMLFTYPEEYPKQLPPSYTLTSKWINSMQLSFLCKKMDALWEENKGSEVIFTWAQYLKENSLEALGVTDTLVVCNTRRKRDKPSDTSSSSNGCDSLDEHDTDLGATACLPELETVKLDTRAVQDVSPSCLLKALREYDEQMRQEVFDTRQFTCNVCFGVKLGSNCIQFWPCRHVYCRLCMKSYFEVQIKEGNFKFLKCPEDKCDSEANPKQVESLVSGDLYDKWDSMLLSSTLSSLGDIQLCPRQHCQYPVTIEESQGHCPSCGFVFCGLCRFGCHGLEKCKFKSGEAKKVLELYLNGTEEDKARLEDRFGRKYLTMMVQEYQTSNYLEENAKTCPKCRSNIEKVDGCNKMMCKQCGINFCWLCERVLDRINPYSHFNSPTSECFNMLFFGIDEDEDRDWIQDQVWEGEDDDF